MNCSVVNRTPDEIRNAFINRNFLWETRPDDPMEVILDRLKFFNDHMTLPEGENQTYWIDGYNIKNRVSTLAKEAYEGHAGKGRVRKEIDKPDFVKKKNAGTRVHNILAEIMDALYNKKGSMSEIRSRASLGDYAIKGKNFDALVNLVQEHIKTIKATQKSIGPGEAKIFVEQKMASPLKNMGGALDVLVIFTDKTVGRIDYKTAHSNRFNYSQGELTDELLSINKVNDYELSMNEYGRILKEDVGLKGDRLVRLSPIHIRLGFKPEAQRKEFDIYSTNVDLIETINSEHLKPIPISGERTPYDGINELLKKQLILLSKLTKEAASKTTSRADKEVLKRRIKAIRKSVQTTIVDGDITDILKSINLLANELQTRVDEPEMIDGKPNLKYLSDSDLNNLIDELSIYQDIIENTHRYYNDLKESNPTLYNKLKGEIARASSNVLGVIALGKIYSEQRLFNLMDKEIGTSYRDENGKPLPLEELDFFTRNFTRFSKIPHRVFQTAWKLIQNSYHNLRTDLRKLDDELSAVEKNLFTWAKANNISREDALKLLVDTNTGMLVSKISKDLVDKINKAFNNPDVEMGVKTIKEIFEIKDINKFKESYKTRLQKFKETQVHKYELGENDPSYKKDIKNWMIDNDLLTSDKAWVNEFNRNYFLRIKDSVYNANLSEGYKRIKNNKALSDYYDLYVKYNKQFRSMLDISDYRTLPPNFIPNIRKSMVDSISMDKLNLKAVGREFWDSLQVRDEDVFIGEIDETGQLKRTIPILFINPFINKDGQIDNTKKSYDLSKNLLLFAKMAYNYKYMNELEPKIMQMRRYMASPTSETQGTKIKTRTGKGIPGKMSTWLTQKGANTDTYKLFEELTDFYLYGIKFKESNIQGGKIDTVKALLKAKQFYGKTTLGLAVIPAFGAYIAGNVSSFLEGSKGIAYNNKHMLQSHKHLISDHQKYTALSLFYDVFAEDPLTKLIENKSANFISRIATTRNLMYPLRKADELMKEAMLNAMALNWGIDIEGKLGKKNALVRLNDQSRDTSGIPTIWDLTTFDKNTGKVEIKGLTNENYIAFRDAVNTASENVIGSLSQEDISRIDTNLMYNIMFQFKSWMPGVIRERFGKLVYDDSLQAARWGRFRAATAELGLTDPDFAMGMSFQKYISRKLLPSVAKFSLDLITFGVATKSGLISDTYTDEQGRTRKTRSNIERAKRMYYQYVIIEHPELMGKLTFDAFLEIKEAQMRAFTNELRAILMFGIIIHMLGGGGGDDKKEPPYMANWLSRFAYKNFTKAQSELTFLWNPGEAIKLFSNPVPMAALLKRAMNTGVNGFDEIRDFMSGENSLSDKTPAGYHMLQWIYGGSQVARLIELYKQHEKTPYLQSITGQ